MKGNHEWGTIIEEALRGKRQVEPVIVQREWVPVEPQVEQALKAFVADVMPHFKAGARKAGSTGYKGREQAYQHAQKVVQDALRKALEGK